MLAAGAALGAVFAQSAPPASLVDYVSRLGVVGLFVLAGIGLHRRWWVPGWVHRDLEARHDRLRERYDAALDVALNSSRGVARTATVVEAALARAGDQR